MRVFLEPKVLVSALATHGLCARPYERLLTEHDVVIGEPVVAEVLDILHRKFDAGEDVLARVKTELRSHEVVPTQPTAPNLPIRDLEDPWIIACALMANVECFVTGDAELLALGAVDGLPVLSPKACWDRLG